MTKKQWAIILIPTVVAGGIIYWQIRKYSIPAKKAIPDTGGSLPKTNSTGGSVQSNTAGCTYPLQKGSNNTCVGQLQDALGVSIDNKFGSQTLAALQQQAGISVISSSNQLSSVIDSIITHDINENIAAANQLILQYGSTMPTYIKTSAATNWIQVTQDGSGNWVSAGYQINFNAGKNISINDYQLSSSDINTGNLIIYCNKGGNMGYWSADPTVLSLV